MAKITIYGTGYVGLVTGVCLAECGHEVFCVDIDEEKIKSLKQGMPTIKEKGLPELLQKNQQAGRIVFTSHLAEAFQHGIYHFIAVGTPESEGQGGAADLTFFNATVSALNAHRTEPFVIITKSTVPVGTAESTYKTLLEAQKKNNQSVAFHIVANPEFLREGCAIDDFLHPDRIVLGMDTDMQVLDTFIADVYARFVEENVPILKMDSRSAELTKYAANAMLATKISFMNELSALAEKTGADIEVVRKGLSLDPRIGEHFIAAGCGFGGSCFPKDIKALLAMGEKQGLESLLLHAVTDVNQHQIKRFSEKIAAYLEKKEKIIALWGLSFKPDTDDIRESPAISIAEALSEKGIKIQAYDPCAMSHVSHFPWITCCSSPLQALNHASALVIATDWTVFKEIDLDAVRTQMNIPAIFDGRNIYDLADMKQRSFDYFSVGRLAILNHTLNQAAVLI